MAAVVAHQALVGAVIGQRDAAAGALGHIAALAAQQHPAVSPAVQQQDALLSGGKILLQFQPQRRAEDPAVAAARSDEGESGKQGARWTDVFAEPGLTLAHDVQHGEREDHHKAGQDDIFEIPQHPVPGEAGQLFGDGNLVQQVLDQAEGT